MTRTTSFPCVIGLFLTVAVAITAAHAVEKATIYRDVWGVPNIYGDSEEAVCYALGYAHAEDRPQQIFDNYRRAVGRLAETDGPGALQFDFYARVFRFEEVCKENWEKVSPKMRACMVSPKMRACVTAFQDSVRRYFKDRPEKNRTTISKSIRGCASRSDVPLSGDGHWARQERT